MNSKFSITELGPDYWEVLRDLKLKSLDQEPLAFEDISEGRIKYLGRSEQEWRNSLSGKGHSGQKLLFFARDESTGNYIGMVSASIQENGDHKVATIQHVYVDSSCRGLGVGKKLLGTIIDKIKQDKSITRINLQVITTQTAAIALYHSFGFKDVRVITKRARRGNLDYDEIEMELISK